MPRILLAGVVILALVISGCKIGGHNSSNAQANLRLLNVAALSTPQSASGSFDPISLSLNSTPEGSGVSFETITPYTSYDSGNTDTLVISDSLNGATVYSNAAVNFSSGINYTLIVYGSSGLSGTVLLEDNAPSLTLNSGYFEIRPVHSAVSAGAMDVYVNELSSSACASATPPITVTPSLSSSAIVTFPALALTSVPLFQQFPSGCYAIYATQQGTKTIIYQSAPQTYSAGDVITFDLFNSGSAFLVNGFSMNQNTALTSVLVPSELARFKLTNADQTAGAVSLQVVAQNAAAGISITTEAVSSTAFAASSSYAAPLTLQAANTLDVLNNTGATIASTNPVPTFAGGGDYSVVAVGSPDNVLVLPADNNLPPSGGNVNIRVVNASPNAGTISVSVNSITLVQSLTTYATSQYQTIQQNTFPGYSISVGVQGGVVGPPAIGNVELFSGGTYTAYVVGASGSMQTIVTRDN